jgi:hypothetical protein
MKIHITCFPRLPVMQHCTTQFEPGELKVADSHSQEVWLNYRYISSTVLTTRVAAPQDSGS